MKKQIIIILLCLLTFSLYSQDYPVYDYELVKTFPVGQGNNELGYDDKNFINSGPSAIAFDNDGNLYVSDILNKRMLKFNSYYEQIKEYTNGYSGGTSQLFITDEGEFICFWAASLGIDDTEGNKKAIVFFNKTSYERKIPNTPNYIYSSNIIFTYLKDGNLISIPDPGLDNKENIEKILNEEQTIKYLQEKYGTQDAKSRTVRTNNSTLTIDESGNIVVDGKIKTSNSNNFFKYKEKDRNNVKENLTKNSNTVTKHIDGFTDEYLSNLNSRYLGKDNDNNTYWHGGTKYIFIFNQKGFLISAFKYNDDQSKIQYPAIHPSGDVYFIDYDDKQVYLYRIKRVW